MGGKAVRQGAKCPPPSSPGRSSSITPNGAPRLGQTPQASMTAIAAVVQQPRHRPLFVAHEGESSRPLEGAKTTSAIDGESRRVLAVARDEAAALPLDAEAAGGIRQGIRAEGLAQRKT